MLVPSLLCLCRVLSVLEGRFVFFDFEKRYLYVRSIKHRMCVRFVWRFILFPGSEKVFDVMQNGMDSLGEDDRNAYVSDFKGFVTYVRDKGFQVYADKVRCVRVSLCSPTLPLVAHDGSPSLSVSPSVTDRCSGAPADCIASLLEQRLFISNLT